METQHDDMNDLRKLHEEVFDGDPAKTAMALGRDEQFIRDVLSGEKVLDEDLAMKARGLLQTRAGKTANA